jgi:hypothetical protein
MQKFSWRTMIIFIMVLLLGVILIGLGIAYVGRLKQDRRSFLNPLVTEHLLETLKTEAADSSPIIQVDHSSREIMVRSVGESAKVSRSRGWRRPRRGA